MVRSMRQGSLLCRICTEPIVESCVRGGGTKQQPRGRGKRCVRQSFGIAELGAADLTILALQAQFDSNVYGPCTHSARKPTSEDIVDARRHPKTAPHYASCKTGQALTEGHLFRDRKQPRLNSLQQDAHHTYARTYGRTKATLECAMRI